MMSLQSVFGLVLILAASTSFTVAAESVVLACGDKSEAPKQPQIAITEEGVVHVAYGVGETVFYCRSEDGGGKYSAPTAAFRCPNLALGMRRGPRIVASGKTVVVTAIGGQQGRGRDENLQAWRMRDGDANWAGPVTINDVSSSAREGLHGMAAGPDGTVWSTWLDLRTKKTEVYIAQSTDHGQTWGPNIRVYRSPDGSVCECCHPSIVVSPKGDVHVLFRNSLGGQRDMYLATSTDGKSFASAKKLGTGSWTLDACPMDGGMLAVDGEGQVLTAWRRQDGIFTTDGTIDEETALGLGEQPFVAALPTGAMTVWTSRRDGDLWMRTTAMKQPLKLATQARDPVVVATTKAGGPVIVGWEGSQNGRRAVFVRKIE